ncbi:MAG TPA: hypothetical protein VFQ58_01290 [Flavisolibacter sp.]|jgi:hypothetical protein|nr:hypothetical protein [Flavisolibacter sp.]
MEINFKYLNPEFLEHLYQKAEIELKDALLKGAEWEEIKEKENILTAIAIERHRRYRPEDFGTPADTPLRKDQ